MILTKDRINFGCDLSIAVSENRLFKRGNKIINLSKDLPLAVMISGNLEFENIPFENLIGVFREKVDLSEIKTVKEVKEEFIEFLSENSESGSIDDYLTLILNHFKLKLSEEISEYGFDECLSYYRQKELAGYIKNYKNFSDEFFELIPDDKDKNKYNLDIWKIFSYQLSFEGTRIIFVGYDCDNYFPSFFEINVHCNDYGKVIFDDVDSGINCEKPIVKVFTINKEDYTFLTGISTDFEDCVAYLFKRHCGEILSSLQEKLLSVNCSPEELKEIMDVSNQYFEDKYPDIYKFFEDYKSGVIEEIFESRYFSQKMMCDITRSLICLTSYKERFTSGNVIAIGETEFAFMTKTDGLEWIKQELVSL